MKRNCTSRRDFLKLSALVLAYLGAVESFSEAAPTGQKELLLLNDAEGLKSLPGYKAGSKGYIGVFDVKKGSAHQIQVGFEGHSVVQDPAHPHHIVSFEQGGQGGALVDLHDNSIKARPEIRDGTFFLGHAAFRPNDNYLVTTEHRMRGEFGYVCVRDPVTLKALSKFPSYGIRPHECRFVENGKVLMVANADGPTNLAWIDVQSGNLLQQTVLMRESKNEFSHFDISHDNWIALTNRRPKSKTYFILIAPDGKTVRFKWSDPPQETGGLTITFLGKTGLMAMSLPDANKVEIWKYRTQELVAAYSVPNAHGLVKTNDFSDKNLSLFATSADKMTLHEFKYDLEAKTFTDKAANPHFGGSGAHLARVFV